MAIYMNYKAVTYQLVASSLRNDMTYFPTNKRTFLHDP